MTMPADPRATDRLSAADRVQRLAASFAMEYLTGHFRPLTTEYEQKSYEQLQVVMLAFYAQARALLLTESASAGKEENRYEAVVDAARAFKAKWSSGCNECGDYNGEPLVNEAQALSDALASLQAAPVSGWRPIVNPPAVDPKRGGSSIRVLGLLPNRRGHVFAQYTPFYLGRDDEAEMLWTCEGYGFSTKPTHWMPLPSPPESAGASARPQEP